MSSRHCYSCVRRAIKTHEKDNKCDRNYLPCNGCIRVGKLYDPERKVCDQKHFSPDWYLHGYAAAFSLPVSWTSQVNWQFRTVSTLKQMISSARLSLFTCTNAYPLYQTFSYKPPFPYSIGSLVRLCKLTRKLFPGYISALSSL